MERYLFVLIILFITVGLFITKTSKIRCEKFNTKTYDKELSFLNQNIDFINKKCNSFGYDNSILNLN